MNAGPEQVNELEVIKTAYDALSGLDESARRRAAAWLSDALGMTLGSPAGVENNPEAGGRGEEGDGRASTNDGGDESPKEFMTNKRPSSNAERIACLAYYQTHYRGKTHFKTADLTSLNTESASPTMSNPSQAAKDATKAGLLASAPKQTRQITSKGEALVKALPDREAAKAATAAFPKPRKKKAAKK